MFGFAFDTGEELKITAYIDDVKNIENHTHIIYRKIRLINTDDASALKSAIKNAAKIYENNGYICLLDHNRSTITKTFISNIEVIKTEGNTLILHGII